MGNLTAVKVKAISDPGRYPDGNGLMLVCKPSGAKSWILRVQRNGRRRDYGLGPVADVSLAEAREKAVETRKLIRGGGDPSEARKASGRFSGRIPTFQELAITFHDERKAGWKNAKHGDQWLSTLEAYAFPKIGKIPVDEISSQAIHAVLSPIWHVKPETARRVSQRVLVVLNHAHFKGWREHEAPAKSVRLGLGSQRAKVKHFASLPYAEMPPLLAALATKQGVGALALRFAILTAARSGEVRGAQWSEIDWTRKLWSVPAERMKAGVKHQVPLSRAALAVLEEAKKLRRTTEGFVFPNTSGGSLSDMTLLKAIRSASNEDATVHGCRASFRNWAAEKTSYPAAAVEKALAHTIQNKAEAAYHRTDYLEIRRKLMADWGSFLTNHTRSNSPP